MAGLGGDVLLTLLLTRPSQALLLTDETTNSSMQEGELEDSSLAHSPLKTRTHGLRPLFVDCDVIDHCREDIEKNKCHRPVKPWVFSARHCKKTGRQVVVFRHIREHPEPKSQRREREKCENELNHDLPLPYSFSSKYAASLMGL